MPDEATIPIKLMLTPECKAKLDVMASAKGTGVSEFATFLIDAADRTLFHGRASELVASQRATAAPAK